MKKQDRTQEIKSGFSYRRKNCMHDKPIDKNALAIKVIYQKDFLIVMKVLRKKLIAGGLGIFILAVLAHINFI